jgi:hypothetical protein
MNSKMVGKLFFFSTNVKEKIMIFHEANKLSSNITSLHNLTLNVIHCLRTELLVAEPLLINANSGWPEQVELCNFWVHQQQQPWQTACE